MATQSLIDFDDDIQQAGVTIDLAIQQQLSELLKVNLSTVGSSNPTQSSSTSTSLLDLNDNDESRVVTAKSSSNPTSKPKTSTCLLDLDDNGELCNAAAEKSQPIQQKNSINSTRPSVQLISNDSSNTLETLSSELKKNAILIPETDPDKPVIVYSNAIGLLFEFAAKQKLKNPCFDQENLGNQFKVKCSFSGVEGEGMGRSLKIAKMQAAQNCLRNFNTARLNKQLDLGEFHKEPDIVTKTNNKNSKPSNAIGELYEHAAKFLHARPEFECREESGLIRTYTVTCSYLTYSETSNNKSKQKAKTEAAAKVYEKLLSTRR